MKKIILVGKGGSGKDYWKNKFSEELGLSRDVSYTSRPPRVGEKEGVDYHFISEAEFEEAIEKDEFVQWDKHAGNYYGTHRASFLSKDLFIMTPKAVLDNIDIFNSKHIIIVLQVNDDLRRSRMISRGDELKKIDERMKIDAKDFFHFVEFLMKQVNKSKEHKGLAGEPKVVLSDGKDELMNKIIGYTTNR